MTPKNRTAKTVKQRSCLPVCALRRQAGQFHDAYEEMRAAAVVADHKRNLYNQMVSDMGGVWQG